MASKILNRSKLLKGVLLLGALYFAVAAFAHFFGRTIFPFYDASLYSPYHDTLITLCDLIFVLLFLTVAKNPTKNVDTLDVMIVALILAVIFNLGIIWKIDFNLLGSSEKLFQTKVETFLAVIWAILLLVLRPKKSG